MCDEERSERIVREAWAEAWERIEAAGERALEELASGERDDDPFDLIELTVVDIEPGPLELTVVD
jgi:hypothetical protein